MTRQRSRSRVLAAVGLTALCALLLPATSLAQTPTPTPSPRVLRVLTPNGGSVGSGALTVTGVAVDCSTGAPARRVAIYDGTSIVQSAYVADVSMDTMRDYNE